jgi:hypothetical protein
MYGVRFLLDHGHAVYSPRSRLSNRHRAEALYADMGHFGRRTGSMVIAHRLGNVPSSDITASHAGRLSATSEFTNGDQPGVSMRLTRGREGRLTNAPSSRNERRSKFGFFVLGHAERPATQREPVRCETMPSRPIWQPGAAPRGAALASWSLRHKGLSFYSGERP